jgi:hypothetical protein
MLMVAPRGSTNDVTRGLTPASSAFCIVKGRVPLLEAVLKAVTKAVVMLRMYAMGERPVVNLKIVGNVIVA